jgi:protein dithiol oxidoreductase (disulfide-forming)
MNRRSLLLGLLAPAVAPLAHAQLLWVEGNHYERINPPVPTSTPGKVEVTEVFSYGCPYCNSAQPLAERIRASLPAYAQMTYVHASFAPAEAWPMFQRAFLTAQALGIAEANHRAMFEAIWETGEIPLVDPTTRQIARPLPNIAHAAKFYARHAGIKEEDFLARSREADIDEAVRRSDALVKAYGISGTPSFVVNGKYRMGKGIRTSDDMVRAINYLVSLERPKA